MDSNRDADYEYSGFFWQHKGCFYYSHISHKQEWRLNNIITSAHKVDPLYILQYPSPFEKYNYYKLDWWATYTSTHKVDPYTYYNNIHRAQSTPVRALNPPPMQLRSPPSNHIITVPHYLLSHVMKMSSSIRHYLNQVKLEVLGVQDRICFMCHIFNQLEWVTSLFTFPVEQLQILIFFRFQFKINFSLIAKKVY